MKMRSFVNLLFSKYNYNDQDIYDEMGRASGTNGGSGMYI
jgi:hypothetical protein